MNLKTLFTVLLVSGQLYGADYFDRGVLRLLTDANQQKLQPENALCLNFVGKNQTEIQPSQTELNECALALCGSPSGNDSVYVTDSNFSRFLTPQIKKQLSQLEPGLKKIFEKEKARKLQGLEEVESKLKKADPARLGERQRRQLSERMFRPHFSEKIDLKKPLSERFSVEIKNEKDLSPDFKSELKKYIALYSAQVQQNPTHFLERGLYSEPEQKQMFTERLQDLKIQYDRFSERMPAYEKNDIPKRIESYLEELSNASGEDLSLALINIQNLQTEIASFNPQKSETETEPDCRGDVCNKLLGDYIKNSDLIPAITRAKNELQKRGVDQQVNGCKAQMVTRLSSESDKKKAEALVNEVKAAMKKNVLPMFSSHSRKLLEDYFKNKLVTSNQNVKNIVKKAEPFEQMKAMYDSMLEMDYMPFEKNEDLVVSDALAIADGTENQSEISGPCPAGYESNAFDSFVSWKRVEQLPQEYKDALKHLPAKDHIFVSPYSCHHELRGKSIVAHELGHALNEVFASHKLSESSLKKYKDFRKCSNENYSEFIPDRVHQMHEGDSIRTEEDTADVFAFMTFPSQDDLFQCGLIKPSPDNQSYADLAFILEDGDTHSTALYRLIMEAVNKKKALPVSCQRALEPLKQELRLKKCAP